MNAPHSLRVACPSCGAVLLFAANLTELLKWDLSRLFLQRGAVWNQEHALAAGHNVARLVETWTDARDAAPGGAS